MRVLPVRQRGPEPSAHLQQLETFFSEGASISRGMFGALFDGQYLPPFLADDRILGAIVYAGQLKDFADIGAAAKDGVLNTAVFGDPATQLRIFRY